ncbi:MAG: DUF5597 domain-containing protein [Clostridia bacterium]|nr:DUF5597 domain-containing protein [Clostridia bacterium]
MDFFRDRAGNPILPLGLQTHNSSTGDPSMLEREIAAVKAYHGNLLEAPIYWFRTEPQEGSFCFDDADDLIRRCRENGLYLVLLWFGASKNGHPNYVPEWVKLRPDLYRVARGRDGGHVASLSPVCEATQQADSRAFAALMAHLREADGDTRTVIAVQVENEMGLANTDFDYSDETLALYRQDVPACLDGIVLEDCGVMPGGSSWRSRFGRHAHEAFMAWAHARYMNAVAMAGRAQYDIPVFTNVMLGEQGYEEAGACYNSGAAVGRVLDIYKAAAPDIDLLCPDMYVPDRERYRRVTGLYARNDNPLFIPESPIMGEANAMNMMEAFADYGCIGMACFGGASALDAGGSLLPEAVHVAQSMKAVMGVAPLLIRWRGTGRVHALVQQEFMDKQYLRLDRYHIEAKFISAGGGRWGLGSRINTRDPQNADVLTARGRALLIQTDEDEFFLSGCGVKVDFRRRPDPLVEDPWPLLQSRQSGTLNFLSVEEGHFEGDRWVCDRCRNGDESNFELFVHRGETVRIRLNPCI